MRKPPPSQDSLIGQNINFYIKDENSTFSPAPKGILTLMKISKFALIKLTKYPVEDLGPRTKISKGGVRKLETNK